MVSNQPNKPISPIAVAGLIIAIIVLFVGDNLFHQIFGRPFFSVFLPIDEQPHTPVPTQNPWAGVIDLSSDGKEIIGSYDVWFSSQAGNRWQIWRLDGVTADLQKVLFDLDAHARLLDQFVPAVSPDGHQIAFSAGSCPEGGSCNRDIYVANSDGRSVVQLTTACTDDFHPSWSPDGKLIIYSSGSWQIPGCTNTQYGLWILDPASATASQLTSQGDWNPSWSPDGRYIVYNSIVPTWDIRILEYATCGTSVDSCSTWVAADMPGTADSPYWINNSAIVFASDKDGDWDIFSAPVLPYETLAASMLTSNDWDDYNPKISNDGRVMIWQAFPYYDDGGDVGAAVGKAAVLYVMDLEQKREAALITGIGNARDGFLTPGK
jgi:Tol biopolymer transport system component